MSRDLHDLHCDYGEINSSFFSSSAGSTLQEIELLL